MKKCRQQSELRLLLFLYLPLGYECVVDINCDNYLLLNVLISNNLRLVEMVGYRILQWINN